MTNEMRNIKSLLLYTAWSLDFMVKAGERDGMDVTQLENLKELSNHLDGIENDFIDNQELSKELILAMRNTAMKIEKHFTEK